MNGFASVGRRSVSLGIALAACALLAVSTQAKAAGTSSVMLPAMDGAAPHAVVTIVTTVTTARQSAIKPTDALSESANAPSVNQQAKVAIAMPDELEIAFPGGWKVGLLAVLVLVLLGRIRLSMKLAKLNQDAVRSSGLSAPFARN